MELLCHVNQGNGVLCLPFAGIIEFDPKQLEVAVLHNLPLTHVSLHRPRISLAFMPWLPVLQRHIGVLMSCPAPCSTCPRTCCLCQLPEPTYLSDAAAGPGSSCPQPGHSPTEPDSHPILSSQPMWCPGNCHGLQEFFHMLSVQDYVLCSQDSMTI